MVTLGARAGAERVTWRDPSPACPRMERQPSARRAESSLAWTVLEPQRVESLPQCPVSMATTPETTTASGSAGGNDGSMKTFHRETTLRTAGGLSVTDITEQVQEAVRESGVRDGVCCVYSPHTTCSVRVNEYERGFLEDFSVLLRRLVPTEHYYAHDDWDRRTENVSEEDMEASNGHSHCMSMLMGPAGESIPVRDGVLCLGRWQRVLFLELDRERDRRWLV